MVAVAPGPQVAQQAPRPGSHPAGTLHERFDHDAGQGLDRWPFEGFQFCEVGHPDDGKAERSKAVVERGNTPEAGRT